MMKVQGSKQHSLSIWWVLMVAVLAVSCRRDRDNGGGGDPPAPLELDQLEINDCLSSSLVFEVAPDFAVFRGDDLLTIEEGVVSSVGLSDPSDPQLRGPVAGFAAPISEIWVRSEYVFAAERDGSIAIGSLNGDATVFTELGRTDLGNAVLEYASSYYRVRGANLDVLELSNPAEPGVVTTVGPLDWADGFFADFSGAAVGGDLLAVSSNSGQSGTVTAYVDISNPVAPAIVSLDDVDGIPFAVSDTVVVGDKVIDSSDPSQPAVAVELGFGFGGALTVGSRVFVSLDETVAVVDMADPLDAEGLYQLDPEVPAAETSWLSAVAASEKVLVLSHRIAVDDGDDLKTTYVFELSCD